MHEYRYIDTAMKNDIDALVQLCLKAERPVSMKKSERKKGTGYFS